MLVGSTMSTSGMQMEELATYMPRNALISYEGLLKPFRMQIKSFALKDAPSTEELFNLMKERNEQKIYPRLHFLLGLISIKKNGFMNGI